MKPEQRTPLEFAADGLRGAIAERTALEAEFARLDEALSAAGKRVTEADQRVKEARRRVIEAAELSTSKETTTP